MKNLYLALYYVLLQRLPMWPVPGWRVYYACRRWCVRKIIKSCGEGVIVRDHCYFGRGEHLCVGARSQMGKHARLTGHITIGCDVLMGPDVVMQTLSHEHSRTDLPINLQGDTPNRPIHIGDDCWIGTRVIILPGVELGAHSIVGAGAVVTHSFPPYSVIGGVPAKLLKNRMGGGESYLLAA